MTNIEKCIAWFDSKGISAWSFDDDSVYIRVGAYEINVSNSEIEYRSVLYNQSQLNMQTINLYGLYAVYDYVNNKVCRYADNGIVFLYGHYMEALERCEENEVPIECTELSPAWQQIIIAQIESINQRTF